MSTRFFSDPSGTEGEFQNGSSQSFLEWSNRVVNFPFMPLVQGAEVQEYGSNANGKFIKLASGVLICFMTKKDEIYTYNSTAKGLFRSSELTFDFPHPFVGSVDDIALTTGAIFNSGFVTFADVNSLTDYSVAIGTFESWSSVTFNTNQSFIAIGLWKTPL